MYHIEKHQKLNFKKIIIFYGMQHLKQYISKLVLPTCSGFCKNRSQIECLMEFKYLLCLMLILCFYFVRQIHWSGNIRSLVDTVSLKSWCSAGFLWYNLPYTTREPKSKQFVKLLIAQVGWMITSICA